MASEPAPPTDPVEALKPIRAAVARACETTSGTPAEPIIQRICGLLDKALPLERRRRVTKR
ncbi:MAG: hypothetical protein INR70_06335 [Parafilimonas terrae]|nr:hypothetical protein [Parafilimonas terrae]